MKKTKTIKVCILFQVYKKHPSGLDRFAKALFKELALIPGYDFHSIAPPRLNFRFPYIWRIQQLFDICYIVFFIPIYLKLNRFDVFIGSHNIVPPFMPRSILNILVLHDLAYRKMKDYMGVIMKAYYNLFSPLSVRSANVIITISQSTKETILEYFPNAASKIEVIKLAAYDELKEDAAKNHPLPINVSAPYILSVGRFEKNKNLERLAQAYSLLPLELRQKYQLVFAGGGRAEIKQRISELMIENQANIVMLGHITDLELASLYKNCYIFAFPSMYEGFGLPVLEANGFGKPIVAANNTSLPEAAGKSAVYVDPYDVNSISQGMQKLLEDPKLHENLSQEALANAAKYSWAGTAAMVIDILNKNLTTSASKEMGSAK